MNPESKKTFFFLADPLQLWQKRSLPCKLLRLFWCFKWNSFFFFLSLQATIGIDFLSKTMYLEDRTVSKIFLGASLCTVGARISICCDGAGIAWKDELSLHLPAASRLTELCRQLPSPLGEGGNRFTLNPFSFWRIQRSFAKCCRFVASSLVVNLTYLNRKRLPSVVTHKLLLLLSLLQL